LGIRDRMARIALIPVSIEGLGDDAKLDNEISGKVFRLDFPTLFPPEPEQGRFVGVHNDAGVGAADEMAAVGENGLSFQRHGHR
jgi:hypothetical protein